LPIIENSLVAYNRKVEAGEVAYYRELDPPKLPIIENSGRGKNFFQKLLTFAKKFPIIEKMKFSIIDKKEKHYA
jgi:hypothetical protein